MPQFHFKIYKPFGVLSQMHSNDPKEKDKRFLGEFNDFPDGIMPVGRLDESSEGLLLLTTDGRIADEINRSGIEKEYWVQVDGVISDEALHRLRLGVEIGIEGRKYTTRPCQAERLFKEPNVSEPNPKLRIGRHRPPSWLRIVINEGKFRQIRKMTAAVGFPTLRLIRNRIGNIELEDMRPGDVVSLNELMQRPL